MTTRMLRILAALAPLALAACAAVPRVIEPERTRQSGAVSTQDFVIQAIDLAWRGMAAAEMGLEKGQDPAVAAHARATLGDWNDLVRELGSLAQTYLPGPTDMSEETENFHQRLAGQSGAAFDAAYREEVRVIVDTLVDLFDAAYATSADPSIRAFIRDWRDVVEGHGQALGAGA